MNVSPRRAALAAGLTAALIALGCGADPKGPGVPDRSTATAAPVPRTTAPAPTAPITTFGDGTRMVGVTPGAILAGTYKTTVPAGSINCYWARLKGTGGELADILANGNSGPNLPVIVTIAASDRAFQSEGCGTWVRVS